MGYDWADLTRRDELQFVMVSQNDLDTAIGTLEGVDLSGSSLSAAYYTDERTSGQLRVVGDGWVRNSLIRIVHRVEAWGYSRELGTYIVEADPAIRENGEWVRTLELKSMLHALETDLGTHEWLVAQGASAKAACSQMLATCKRPHLDLSSNDRVVSAPIVYESGTSYLTRLLDLCTNSDNRLDVDGHGNVTIAPYVPPAARQAAFRLDLADPRGIVEDGISLNTDYLSMPGRAIVSYRYSDEGSSDQREIVAVADATGEASSAARGYMVADFQSLTEMEPATYERALQIARETLESRSREKVEWEINCAYLPIWEGDVVELVVHDGDARYQGVRHCLVKNVELSLEHMSMRLTLKETASGDDE